MSMLEGSVEGIIFSNEDNGYTILELITDQNELITAVGIMPYVGEGESLKVYGKWVHNPKYGRQFSVSSYEKVMPADEVSILRYLASGAIKGIGPKTAQRIVDVYGKDTFDVIENHPEWLAEISGITPKKAGQIGEEFQKSAGMRSTMMFFREFFGAALTMKIYKRWGSRSVELAKENPYILCEEIDGIGFEKADGMARSLGFSAEGLERISSGIIYMMRYRITQNGHVCLPEELLISSAAKLLDVGEEIIAASLSSLIAQGRICYVKRDGVKYIYEKESYDAEKYIARKLDLIDKVCASVGVQDMQAFISREERRSGIEYAPLQKKAIAASLEDGVMILTGGPGTGKTTVVRALIEIFDSMGLDVALAAPTGRAANRMSEATSREAKTIHRLLEMDFSDSIYGKFNRDENNLLDEDVIIIDEASMIDQNLMFALLKAVKPGARLIIIGDSDQLPSVGAGNILRDLIDGGRFSTIRLSEIFRQASESLIVTNAHAINAGQMPDLSAKDKDFFFLPRQSDADIAFTVADLCKNRLPKAYGTRLTANMQVISPSRKGEAGTENLNVLLQNTLNPEQFGKKEYKYRQTVFRQGDRVMQTKNNYDLEWKRDDGSDGYGVFNGDIGVIYDIDFKEQSMDIVFDDRSVKYDFSYLEELEHAYAITVHKSQGSEYPIVIIPAYSAPRMLLTRNMLYTAVTRAKNMVIVVGREDIVKTMVDNNKQTLRYTGLAKLFEV
ncbi:MAG: ATP-dependent RecD-like DNA helicase [Clostridia bacterium]|nr:ATP-dependent RecD-like DNA helicase [Clostridia bacterium]